MLPGARFVRNHLVGIVAGVLLYELALKGKLGRLG